MHKLLKQTRKLNKEMSSLTQEFEWKKALTLAIKRDHYLKEYFELSPLPDDNLVISKIVSEISMLDETIKELINNTKSHLINESLSLKKTHHALQQYSFAQAG